MKNQLITSKVLFKLNNHLLKENFPRVTPVKLNQKQNSSFAYAFDDGFKFIPKKSVKSIKPFNLPKRFKKHNNKIQDNMAVMNKTSTDFVSTSATKTCSSSFYKPLQQSQKQAPRNSVLSRHRSKLSMNQIPKQSSLQPRTLQGIEKALEQKYTKKHEKENNKKTKQYQTMLRLRPRKISKQISQIFYENKHLYMLSRFTLLELKSYYCAILKFSKGEPSKFKYAFEIMLNLANVTVRENIMTECLKQLMHGGLTFTKFLKAFTSIQQKLRKQKIIDYFQILLEDVKTVNITYDELIKTFEGRMKNEFASELSVLLYEKLGKDETDTINKKQINTLCYENEQFCTMFYALNNQSLLNNKFAPDGKSS